MHLSSIAAPAALLLLAACGEPKASGNDIVAEANATGNAASSEIEQVVRNMSGTPMEKEQALAFMKERHENYEKIGDAMKAVSRELKSESPDLAIVRQNAAAITEVAPRIRTWFPAGTGPDVGKTEAKAEIWQDPKDFAAKAVAFNEAAKAFQQASQGSDVAAIRAAHADLGKSCKACHDLYREEH